MDASSKAQAEDPARDLGLPPADGASAADPLNAAAALIARLEEALRRTVAASPACPYCQTPTYLRRHHAGCGLSTVLQDTRNWRENHSQGDGPC